MKDGLLYEVFEYDNLCTALEMSYADGSLMNEVANVEEFILNIQNHLMWHSYSTFVDDDTDCVVLTAINIVLEKHGLKFHDLSWDDEPYIKRILTDFTTV